MNKINVGWFRSSIFCSLFTTCDQLLFQHHRTKAQAFCTDQNEVEDYEMKRLLDEYSSHNKLYSARVKIQRLKSLKQKKLKTKH
ncbi:hypothetical protein VNO78_31648 [Psophocarpus tetragonolobus]|uniref:Uncharacterized protein n=1 Tax=Psophocarpus tetragonolobus TaxID=3891 RepID=A0AAN9RZF9_PSOTE